MRPIKVFTLTVLLLALQACTKPSDILETVTKNIPGTGSDLPESVLISSLDEKVPDTTLFGELSTEGVEGEGVRAIDEEFIGSSNYHKVNNKQLSLYLDEVATRLLNTLPEKYRPEYRIFINYDEKISGHVTFKKDIYLTTSIITNMTSEDQLAFLLGHELSHLVLKHNHYSIDRAGDRKLIEKLKKTAVGLVAMSNLDAKALLKDGEKKFRDDNDAEQQIHKVSRIGKNILQIKKGLIDPAYDRDEEQGADYLALDMMIAAGYNTNGQKKFMDILRENRKNVKAKTKRLDKALKVSKTELTITLKKMTDDKNVDPDKFKNMMKEQATNLVVSTLEDWLKTWSSKHFNPDKRTVLANEYVNHYYQQRPAAKTKKAQYTKMKESSRIDEIISDMDKLSDIERKLEGENSKKGLALLSQDVLKIMRTTKSTTKMNKNSYSWMLLAEIRSKQNKTADVVYNLNKATGMENPYYKTFSLLSDLYIQKKQYGKAEKVLSEGNQVFDNEVIFAPQWTEVYIAEGDVESAQRTDKKCKQQQKSSAGKLKSCVNMPPVKKQKKQKPANKQASK